MGREDLTLVMLALAQDASYTPVQIQKAMFLADDLVRDAFDSRYEFAPYDYGPFDPPYALEIGQLTRARNALHDTLGEIFTQIVSPSNANVSRAIWYSIMSDKTQRDILKAAYLAWGAIDPKKHPKAKEDIKWLIKTVDNLGFQRNDAIHAPILVGKSARMRMKTNSWV
jgi:hypothetical protein